MVYKVLLLLIEEFGGCRAFLTRFRGKPFKISTGPCCCCCPCLPHVPMSWYLRRHVVYFAPRGLFGLHVIHSLSVIQANAALAEVGCSSVCHPEDDVLCLLHHIVDKWHLRPFRRKRLKQLSLEREGNSLNSVFAFTPGHSYWRSRVD